MLVLATRRPVPKCVTLNSFAFQVEVPEEVNEDPLQSPPPPPPSFDLFLPPSAPSHSAPSVVFPRQDPEVIEIEEDPPEDEEIKAELLPAWNGAVLPVPALPLPSGATSTSSSTFLNRPFFCSVCSKRFSRKDVLMTHLRTHTGEKPHVCNICHKAFNRKFNLKIHRRIHSGERPYTCKYCQRTFAHKNYHVKHERTCVLRPGLESPRGLERPLRPALDPRSRVVSSLGHVSITDR